MSSMIGQSPLRGSTGLSSGKGMTGGNVIPKGFERGQLNQFTPEQMNLFQSLFSHIGPDSYLSKLAGGDQSQFEQTERPALRQFQGLQGQLASRFSGMGSGARKSSGFQNTINQAGSDLSENLASRRMELQSQAIRDLMGMGNSLLQQRPYEQFLLPKQQPFWQQLLGGLAPGVGQGLGQVGGGAAFKAMGLGV